MVTPILNPEHPNRATVRQALQLSEWHYYNLIHKYFVIWCEAMAERFYRNDRDLIANNTIHNYYNTQWRILVENRMIMDYGRYMKKRLPDTVNFYLERLFEYAVELLKYYPASLLNDPKKSVTKQKYQLNYN